MEKQLKKAPFLHFPSIYRGAESDRCPVKASGDRRTRLLDIYPFPGDGYPTSPEGSLPKTLEIGLIGEASNISLLTPKNNALLCPSANDYRNVETIDK